jgi:hypothetical protein
MILLKYGVDCIDISFSIFVLRRRSTDAFLSCLAPVWYLIDSPLLGTAGAVIYAVTVRNDY